MSTKSKMQNLITYAEMNRRATPHSLMNTKDSTGGSKTPTPKNRSVLKASIAIKQASKKRRPRDFNYSPGDESPRPTDALYRSRSGGGWNPR
jgi:hypothetical protein